MEYPPQSTVTTVKVDTVTTTFRGAKSMETKSKTEYIKAWNDHIADFNTLKFCENDIDRRAVQSAQDILRKAVLNIAETKDFEVW